MVFSIDHALKIPTAVKIWKVGKKTKLLTAEGVPPVKAEAEGARSIQKIRILADFLS